MARQTVERIVCFAAYAGVIHAAGDCSYENQAIYDDWEELVTHMKAALDAGLQVMVEPELMTELEYEALGGEFPDDVNPLLGGRR